jgi:predicted nuclease of predicted toxin-antitoxin system
MKCIVDNNLPVTLVRCIRCTWPEADIDHIHDLGLHDCCDDGLRQRWQTDPIIWITRDEDFWLRRPDMWAVIWIACHNPSLAFLRDHIAPTIATVLPTLRPGTRVMITEDGVWSA